MSMPISGKNKKNIEKNVCWNFYPAFLALNLKGPSKISSRWHFIFIFLIFQSKQVLIFHVNRLPSRWFTWNIKTCFLWKIKKIYFKMSSAAVVIGALRVKCLMVYIKLLVLVFWLSFSLRREDDMQTGHWSSYKITHLRVISLLILLWNGNLLF